MKRVLQCFGIVAFLFSGLNSFAQCPQITCPSNYNVSNDPGQCGAKINYNVLGVDKCGGPDSMIFNYTGSRQMWVVPQGVDTLVMQAWGAAGGADGQTHTVFGLGGYAAGAMIVNPGDTLWIYVGGTGAVPAGGFNGGGNGGTGPSTTTGAGGGGASDIRTADTLTARVLVAAGGGGAGGATTYSPAGGAGGGGNLCTSPYGYGGALAAGACASSNPGGCAGGATGTYGSGGGGGGLNSGGAGGGAGTGSYGTNGVFGIGGDGGSFSNRNGGGGGGGGYYGGGGGMSGNGGCNGGGGGGSSYANTTVVMAPNMNGGVRSGNGLVKVYWNSGPVTVTQLAGLPKGALFPVGTTTNTFFVSGASGPNDTCSFTVTVTDTGQATSLAALSQDTICTTGGNLTLPAGTPAGGTYSGAGVTGNSFDPSIAERGDHWVYYTDTVGCQNSDSVLITVVWCTGIAESPIANNIQVAPNPSDGVFTLNITNELQDKVDMVVTDVTGKRVYVTNSAERSIIERIDLTAMEDGLYILTVRQNGQSMSYRLIKQ